ncbi:lantibiotic dehydratase [Streptomonospora arabica]
MSERALDVVAEEFPRFSEFHGFHVGPHPLLRVNLTEAADLWSQRGRDDSGLLAELDGLHREQAAAAPLLSDLLYDIAGRVDRARRQAVVLPLRRAIHNGRMPKAPVDTSVFAEAAGGGAVREWLDRQERIEKLRRELHAGYEETLDEERRRLAAVLHDGYLGRSLAVSSPLLPEVADRYRTGGWARPGKKTRKAEASLLRYAMRAAAKTSPYSQYTAVEFLTAEAEPASELRIASAVQTNQAFLRRVEAGIARLPSARDLLTLHPSAGLRHVDGQLVAVGDRDQLGEEAAAVAERYGEAQVTTPAKPAVMALLSWLEKRPDASATFAELAAVIEQAVPGADAAAAASFIERLRGGGVLAAAPLVDEHAPDPLERLCSWLAGCDRDAPGGGTAADVGDHLDRIVRAQRDFATAEPDRRVALLRSSRADSEAALGLLGDDVARRAAPEPLWFEDCRLADPVTAGTADFSAVLRECRDLMGILEIFDEQHVFSRVLSKRFTAQYGTGGECPDLDALGELYLPAYGDALQITEGFEHELIETDPVIGELVALRRSVLTPLVADLRAASSAGTAAPVEIAPEVLERVRREVPAWVRDYSSSYSVFLQPLGGRPATGAVLNKIYNGWGNYLSRFLTHAPAEIADAVRATLRAHYPDTDTVAELRPVQGFNANVHPLLAETELDFDRRGGGDRIPLERLSIRHDPRSDRVQLWDTATGRRVHPLYLGFLIPYYLPSRLVPLTAIAGSGSVMFEPQVSADRAAAADRGGVRHYPRVAFGGLTLARARWHVPAESIPRSRPDEGAADYFVRLNEWRAAAGLPDEVFLHPPAPELDPGKVNDYFNSYLGNRKPQYVALLSRLHVRHLERLLVEQPGAEIVFEEALPAPSQALPIAQGRHTAELVAEFYRPARPPRKDAH